MDRRNTSFAKVNARKPVWWLGIYPSKFEDDLYLLLLKEGQVGLLLLEIESNTFPVPEKVFKKRENKNTISLEISSIPPHYMTDVRSGGTRYNFTKHIKYEWELAEGSEIADSVIHSEEAMTESPYLFEGTDAPLKELDIYMRKDWNLYGFLREFPSVSMEQALAEMERDSRETIERITQRDQKIANGALVFERSDVPVERLFDYLADVKSLKDFHWDYPSAFREDTYDAAVTSGRFLELDAYRGVENSVVHSHRGIVSGAPIFVGYRMPVRIVFDYLSEGKTLRDFHFHYDTGTKEHLVPALKLAYAALEREFHAAASR